MTRFERGTLAAVACHPNKSVMSCDGMAHGSLHESLVAFDGCPGGIQ